MIILVAIFIIEQNKKTYFDRFLVNKKIYIFTYTQSYFGIDISNTKSFTTKSNVRKIGQDYIMYYNKYIF